MNFITQQQAEAFAKLPVDIKLLKSQYYWRSFGENTGVVYKTELIVESSDHYIGPAFTAVELFLMMYGLKVETSHNGHSWIAEVTKASIPGAPYAKPCKGQGDNPTIALGYLLLELIKNNFKPNP